MQIFWNTIKLLRLPFSLFLLPVSLFSLYFIEYQWNYRFLLLFIIWHFLVFPSSNGFNSYHDKDESPIGGLEKPPLPTKHLYFLTILMDLAAILLSYLVHWIFPFFVLGYILFSRMYSYKPIRLKKYPIVGFLVVFIFQGIWIFGSNLLALSNINLFSNQELLFAGISTSFFIGTVYPITQIYQHEADRKDGIRTLSLMLGYKGTFLFSALMFTIANLCIYLTFKSLNKLENFYLFNLIMLPSTLFFILWGIKSFKNTIHIHFKNTMIMVILSSILLNIYFIILLLKT